MEGSPAVPAVPREASGEITPGQRTEEGRGGICRPLLGPGARGVFSPRVRPSPLPPPCPPPPTGQLGARTSGHSGGWAPFPLWGSRLSLHQGKASTRFGNAGPAGAL